MSLSAKLTCCVLSFALLVSSKAAIASDPDPLDRIPLVELSDLRCFWGSNSGFPIPHVFCRDLATFDARNLPDDRVAANPSLFSLEEAMSTLFPSMAITITGPALVMTDQSGLPILEQPLPEVPSVALVTPIELLRHRLGTVDSIGDMSVLWDVKWSGPGVSAMGTRATFHDTGESKSLEELFSDLFTQSSQLGFYVLHVSQASWQASHQSGQLSPNNLPAAFVSGEHDLFCRIVVAHRGFYLDYEYPADADLFRALPYLLESEIPAFRTDADALIGSLALSGDESTYRRSIRLAESVTWLPRESWHFHNASGIAQLRLLGLILPRSPQSYWISGQEMQSLNQLMLDESAPITPLEAVAAAQFLSRGGVHRDALNWVMIGLNSEAAASRETMIEASLVLIRTARAANRPDLEAVFLEAFRGGEAYRSNPVQWDALLTAAEELEASFQTPE